jgi:hypothetical protein
VVAETARKIKRYFINDAKSFGSCSLHPYSFRWVTIALSYGDSLGARSTQFTIRNLMFPDDLVVFEQGNQPWSRFGSSHFELLDEELELSFGFLRSSVLNLNQRENQTWLPWGAAGEPGLFRVCSVPVQTVELVVAAISFRLPNKPRRLR